MCWLHPGGSDFLINDHDRWCLRTLTQSPRGNHYLFTRWKCGVWEKSGAIYAVVQLRSRWNGRKNVGVATMRSLLRATPRDTGKQIRQPTSIHRNRFGRQRALLDTRH